MTREQKRKILQKHGIEQLEKEDNFFESILLAIDECIKSPEPIPQDWQAWIEEQAEKYGFQIPYDGSDKFYADGACEGFTAGATAMLPFLEEKDKIIKAWNDGQNDFTQSLQQQISERDTEIERLKAFEKMYDESTSALYWKQRCEAAEDVLSFYDGFLMGEEEVIVRDKWQQLKSHQP